MAAISAHLCMRQASSLTTSWLSTATMTSVNKTLASADKAARAAHATHGVLSVVPNTTQAIAWCAQGQGFPLTHVGEVR